MARRGRFDCVFASSNNAPTPGDVRTRHYWLAQCHKPVAVGLSLIAQKRQLREESPTYQGEFYKYN